MSMEAEDDWVRAVGAFKEENGGMIKTLSTLRTITSCQYPSSQSKGPGLGDHNIQGLIYPGEKAPVMTHEYKA